jgi:hypothetical protein
VAWLGEELAIADRELAIVLLRVSARKGSAGNGRVRTGSERSGKDRNGEARRGLARSWQQPIEHSYECSFECCGELGLGMER